MGCKDGLNRKKKRLEDRVDHKVVGVYQCDAVMLNVVVIVRRERGQHKLPSFALPF